MNAPPPGPSALVYRAMTDRDPVDNADQPPEVDVHDDTKKLPPAVAAARRVLDFVTWFGDGEILPEIGGSAPLYARDLEALARAVQERS